MKQIEKFIKESGVDTEGLKVAFSLSSEESKEFKSRVKKQTIQYIKSTLIKDLSKISDKVIKDMKLNKDHTVYIDGVGDAMLPDYINQVIHDEIYLVRPSKVPTFKD